jgi:uncharacterized protein YbjT (DUF2867 family)
MDKGAEIWFSEHDDIETITDSFKDTYAIFSMIPPGHGVSDYDAFQDRVSHAICQAITQANVTRVVNLSSVGGELAEGTGMIKGLHEHEQRLDTLKTFSCLVHLRPNFFMENLTEMLPMIQDKGVLSSAIDAKLPIPMVATRDIGWKAADFLVSTAPQPHLVFDFVGPREVTMQQATAILAQAFDHPDLRYQQISYDEEANLLLESGLPQDLVTMLVEMYKGFNTGMIKPTQELKPSHHGRTTLEEFIQMIAHKTIAHV